MGPNDTSGPTAASIGFSVAAVSFTVMMVAFNCRNRIDPTDLTTVEFLNQTQSGIVVAAPANPARCRLDDLLGLVPRTFCERGSLINGGTCERTG